MIPKQQHLNLCFSTCSFSTHSPPLPSQPKTVSSIHCNKLARLSLRKTLYTCKTARVCELRERVSFEKSGGKFPCLSARHCSVSLKDHACGWKTKRAELSLSVLVEKHPPTDRPTVYLQCGSHIEKCLPIEITLTLLQGAKLRYT